MIRIFIFLILISSTSLCGMVLDSSKVKKDTTNKIKASLQTLQQVFGLKPFSQKELPKVAAVRSIFLPGWGQITNKQYYKLPFIYGAAGVGVYFIVKNDAKCKEYVGHLQTMQNNKTEEIMIDGRGVYSKTLITNAARTYRRWKQGTVIGFSLGWLLFAVDANVSAHLKTFDMSDDISFKIKPTLLNLNGRNAAGLSLNFELK